MKTSSCSSPEKVGGLLHRTFSAGALAIILASGLPLMFGCRCPDADHPRVVADDPTHADLIKATLDNAQAKKTWTPKDEAAFRSSLGHLSPQTRMASALRLSALINSRAVLFDRSPSKSQPTCPCTPAICERVPTPPVAAPPATSVPPVAVPPATKAR